MDPAERRAISTWMARLADGDREAFTPLFERLWPVVRSFTARALGHDADADDVAQRAMVSLFARASAYDTHRDGLAWALGIAAWECRTLRRRQQRRRELPQDAAASVRDDATPEHALLEAELAAAFCAITGSLDAEDRRALGLEPDGGPASPALRKRKQRALLRLRAVWSRMHGTGA
ncbi:MAG: sigma-70 family RNA polymerase sigma factor [Nannocystaceae bacterium]|nr:sigma-70 family RNA polymerase sigma factor [Nannocystaceae bacterium]